MADGYSLPEWKATDGLAWITMQLRLAIFNTLLAAQAQLGPDRTTLEIWADPGVTRNIHRVEVESDSARFSMSR